jgi:hypothetical protein
MGSRNLLRFLHGRPIRTDPFRYVRIDPMANPVAKSEGGEASPQFREDAGATIARFFGDRRQTVRLAAGHIESSGVPPVLLDKALKS